MTRSLRTVSLAACATALCLAFAGCAGMYGVRTTMYRAAFAPTSSVEVFRLKAPARPYVEIAQLQTYNDEKAVSRLVGRAREIGANAIVILGEKVEGADVTPTFDDRFRGTRSYETTYLTDLVAVAIRYR